MSSEQDSHILILTDSGGIQEEAPSLGAPVLVLREVAERLLDDPAAYAAMARAVNSYGDGHAAERIVAALLREGDKGTRSRGDGATG